MALSKDIDEGHKKEVAEQCIVSQDLADQEQIERVYIDKFSDNELRNCETSINVSQNWSGVVGSTKCVAEVGTQTEFHMGAV